MKVVHLLGWYFPDSVGGTEVYVAALCRHLRPFGHESTIAAPIATGVGSGRTYVHDGVSVFRYGIPRDLTRDEACHRTPIRGVDAFHEWLAASKPDLLHVHSFASGVGLPEIRHARRIGIRVIVTCHLPGLGYMCRAGELMQWGEHPCDGIVETTKRGACNLTRPGMPKPIARACALPTGLSDWFAWIPGRLGTVLGMTASVAEYRSMQRELFQLVDRFVVLNETARRMLIANGSPTEKIAVNRLGVGGPPTIRKVIDRPTGKPVRLGYVGRLHETKGVAELVGAARRVPADVDFRLSIRGPVIDATTSAFVNRLRAVADDDERISFEEGVPPSEMPSVLAALDVLVCPSLWFENGPTVALEANAVGTPVLASAVGNLVEIVQDGWNGRLVPAGATAAWTAAVAEIAQYPDRTVDVWRTHLSAPRTMDEIARDYVSVYAA
jgi:glycosyltransferase involved in cell wall biosynthesis